jgi:serine/threonine protein kinase
MKICPNCDRQFGGEDSHFCPDCQTRLEEVDSPNDSSGIGQQEELIGRVFFGEYTIVERLGEGGMGSVYLAEQNAIDQRIAIKVLHAESAESNEIIQRFHREAKVISMLTHPNIVRVFIFGRTDDDLLFLAMEHVDGVELRERMTPGDPLDELTAIKIMKQVCSAVAEAHDLGIIHRDLKPENILLTEFRGDDNYVKILDFGIAKIKRPDETGPQLTQAGIVHGTPEYLSPEQAQDEDLDPRTDIYALGSILFEMMTGRVPFDSKKSVEILRDKVFNEPPSPSDFASVAPTMEEIIQKAMAKDREDRYSDALEMFDELERREKEIETERKVAEDGASFPGHELTGVHQAVDEGGSDESASESATTDREAVPGAVQEDEDIDEADYQADTIAMEATGQFEDPSGEPPSSGGAQAAPSNARAASRDDSPARSDATPASSTQTDTETPGTLVALWQHRAIRYTLIAMAAIGCVALVATAFVFGYEYFWAR